MSISAVRGSPAQAYPVPPDAAISLGAAVDDAHIFPTVRVTRLRVENFRSYANADLCCAAPVILLTGANGAGKSNLLEALSLLSPGRGLRGASFSELVHRPGVSESKPCDRRWLISADVMISGYNHRVGTLWDGSSQVSDGEAVRRQLRLDAAPISQKTLGSLMTAVWLTPDMEGLLGQGRQARRLFLDRLVQNFDPAHAGRLRVYQNSFRQRTQILSGEFSPPGMDTASVRGSWLDALERRLAEHWVAIAAARLALVRRLSLVCAEHGEDWAEAQFPAMRLEVEGKVERLLEKSTALEIEDNLTREFALRRESAQPWRRDSFSAARSDFLIWHVDNARLASSCSTGEQKVLLLAIILAHARLLTVNRRRAPLILLDEVAAHLDRRRRDCLLRLLPSYGAQVWLTATESSAFDRSDDRVARVEVNASRLRVLADFSS